MLLILYVFFLFFYLFCLDIFLYNEEIYVSIGLVIFILMALNKVDLSLKSLFLNTMVYDLKLKVVFDLVKYVEIFFDRVFIKVIKNLYFVDLLLLTEHIRYKRTFRYAYLYWQYKVFLWEKSGYFKNEYSLRNLKIKMFLYDLVNVFYTNLVLIKR